MATKTETQTEQARWLSLEPIVERFTGIKRTTIDEQRAIYEQINGLARQYKGAPFLEGHFGFDESVGITGSNLGYLILANKALSRQGSRTLTFQEGMELDKKGLLQYGVYREFGIAVYSSEGDIEKKLVDETKIRGWELPIIAHPLSLDLGKNGIDVLFGEDTSLVLTGEEAREELKSFNLTGDSDVRRVIRGRYGDWYAYWGALFFIPTRTVGW